MVASTGGKYEYDVSWSIPLKATEASEATVLLASRRVSHASLFPRHCRYLQVFSSFCLSDTPASSKQNASTFTSLTILLFLAGVTGTVRAAAYLR